LCRAFFPFFYSPKRLTLLLRGARLFLMIGLSFPFESSFFFLSPCDGDFLSLFPVPLSTDSLVKVRIFFLRPSTVPGIDASHPADERLFPNILRDGGMVSPLCRGGEFASLSFLCSFELPLFMNQAVSLHPPPVSPP